MEPEAPAAPEPPAQRSRRPAKRRPGRAVRLGAVAALAVAAGLLVWVLVDRSDDEKAAQGTTTTAVTPTLPTTPSETVSQPAIRTIAAAPRRRGDQPQPDLLGRRTGGDTARGLPDVRWHGLRPLPPAERGGRRSAAPSDRGDVRAPQRLRGGAGSREEQGQPDPPARRRRTRRLRPQGADQPPPRLPGRALPDRGLRPTRTAWLCASSRAGRSGPSPDHFGPTRGALSPDVRVREACAAR